MAKISVVLNEQKKKGDETIPIYIRIADGNMRKRISIGWSVLETDWDPVTQQVLKSNKDHVAINALITKKKAKLNAAILNIMALEEKPRIITGLGKKEKKLTKNNFFLIAEEYFAELEKAHKYSRISGEKPRVKHLKAFAGKGQLPFEEIDVSFLKKFQVFLKSVYNCSERTVMNHLIVVRTIYNYGIREGVADKNNYPIGRGKISIRIPESIKMGLNPVEVKQIEEADFSDNEHLHHTRNVWLFSFYMAGMRISDVLRLRWTDFTDGRLNYEMGKNHKIVSLKLPDKAVAILEIYEIQKRENNGFVFPDFRDVDLKNLKQVFRKTNQASGKLDRHLKKIAEKLGITKKLTNHISRHTFGNITGDKISPQMLQKLYRHTDIKTTMGYQANFIHNDVDDALESVLNF